PARRKGRRPASADFVAQVLHRLVTSGCGGWGKRAQLLSATARHSWPGFGLHEATMTSIVNQEGDSATKRTGLLVGLVLVALIAASAVGYSIVRSRTAEGTVQTVEPVDAQLAAKAESSCWFKVKNRSSRTDEVRQWESVVSTGAKTERLG